MPDGERGRASHEPGHRYAPRHIVPRVFDVSQQRKPEPAMPVSAPVPKVVTQPPASQPTVSLQTSVDVRPAPKQVVHKERPVSAVKPAAPRQRRSLVLRRQIVDRAQHHSNQLRAQRQRAFVAFAFGGLAASVLLVGAFSVYLQGRSQPQVLSEQTRQTAAAATSGSPLEDQVTQSQVDAYQVSAGDPRLVRIPRLGLQARIYPVAADYGGVPLPAGNIHDVGWLKTSSRTGQSGVTLLNGSVAGISRAGVFGSLSNLVVGDRIQVEMGDGTVSSYKVTGSRSFEADAVDMQVALRSSIPGKEALNLLTDQGRFVVKANKYEPRTLITAVLE